MPNQTHTKTCPDCNGVGIDEFDPTLLCGTCIGEGVVSLEAYRQYKEAEAKDAAYDRFASIDDVRFEKIPRRKAKYV